MVRMSYSIKVDGDWLDKDKLELYDGIDSVAYKLASMSGLSLEDAFRCVFGEITLEAVDRCPGGWDAYVAPGVPDRIQFKRGKVTVRLVIHELGHIVNDTDGGE
jgi:hypothetical protein